MLLRGRRCSIPASRIPRRRHGGFQAHPRPAQPAAVLACPSAAATLRTLTVTARQLGLPAIPAQTQPATEMAAHLATSIPLDPPHNRLPASQPLAGIATRPASTGPIPPLPTRKQRPLGVRLPISPVRPKASWPRLPWHTAPPAPCHTRCTAPRRPPAHAPDATRTWSFHNSDNVCPTAGETCKAATPIADAFPSPAD